MWFKNEFAFCLLRLEDLSDTISSQALQKTIEQRVIQFGYPKMHLVSHILVSIRRMGSGDRFNTDISEHLHIANVKEA
jgi:hypothetical protein